MNFALVFETVIAAMFLYTPGLVTAVSMYPLKCVPFISSPVLSSIPGGKNRFISFLQT